MIRTRLILVFFVLLIPAVLFAQQQPPQPPSPALGNAVLLATQSLQVDRDVVVNTGDLVVNNPLGTMQLDSGVRTPGGYAIKADAIAIDGGAIINGDAHFNTLTNLGTINGALVTPLAFPAIPNALPQPPNRAPGLEDVTLANGEMRPVGRGNYGALHIGRDATVRLPGGPVTFTSITAERGATMIWDGPGDILVHGDFTAGADFTITNRPDVTTKHKMFFILGNVSIGRDSAVAATIHALNGTITAAQSLDLHGQFLAANIVMGAQSSLTVRSGFRNIPPVAFAQTVAVGTGATPITLTGFDPDADPLTFNILVQPVNGTLGPITPAGPTSAVVVYTPRRERPNDVFTFRVTDSEGFLSPPAAVTINEGIALPQPPATVIANDVIREVPAGPPTSITLPAVAPPGTPLVFSIVPNSGPFHGTLGPVQQPSMQPPLPARVLYVPQQGFVGEDGFRFRACGVIGGVQVCDEGLVSLAVTGPEPPQELAPDFTYSGLSGTAIAISLVPEIGRTSAAAARREFTIAANASFLNPATVAGAVADSNGDGLGDAAVAAPLVAAGINQENGTNRIHLEFDVTGFMELISELQTANVVLRTNRGPNDALTTFFSALGTSGDGQLNAADYQIVGEQIPHAVMPVPVTQPVGADGTFTFDVLPELRAALEAGFTHFAIHGRVNEGAEAEGPVSGLHIRTEGPARAQLAVSTGTVATGRIFRILTLPANGTLTDSNGNVVGAVPYVVPTPVLTYRSFTGFSGANTFQYSVTDGQASDTGIVTINVAPGDGNGRD